MIENHFVFADLSTYELNTAKQFYSQVFDWEYTSQDDTYHMATYGKKEIVGIYETPQKFKEMKMPSFWMSYIQVDSVTETVAKAKELNGIVELVDLKNPIGKIALIRDPLGAGFTIYEGEVLQHRYKNAINALVWNELFISNLSKIKPFYEGIFSWTITQNPNGRHHILDSQKHTIGHINEVDNAVKGKYEYWGVFFSVEDPNHTKQKVLKNNGSLIAEDAGIIVLADLFGAFFHIVPVGSNKGIPSNKSRVEPIKWRALLGLVLILTYFVTAWAWIWSLFFAFWVFMDLRSGKTHLLEPISKKHHLGLYWIVVATWAFLGAYSILYNNSL